jgi:hypothetical protein
VVTGGPRTQAGRYLRGLLRACAFGELGEVSEVLNLDDDAPELALVGLGLDAGVALLAARRFPAGAGVRELHRYVAGMPLEPDEHQYTRMAEMYLRARLGEPYLLPELDPEQLGEPLGLLLRHLAEDLPLTGSDIDDLAVEAEGMVERLARGTRVSLGTWELLASGPVALPEARTVDWSAIPRPVVTGEAPCTRPGAYVRALVLPDRAVRDRLSAQMRGTPELSTAIAITRALARQVLRTAFPPPVDLRQLTATLAHVRAGFQATHLSLVEMDAVARAELGEDAFLDGIPLRVRHTTRSTFVAATVQEVPFTPGEVDALVAAAETQVLPPS